MALPSEILQLFASARSSALPPFITRSFFRHVLAHQSRHYSTRPQEASANARRKKVTIRSLQTMYMAKTPISMLTAYDYPTASFVEQAGIDVCLVGDSLAMVACGYNTTAEIGMEEMLYHSRSVARGAKTPLLIADLPFGSFEESVEQGVRNALRMVKEGGMEGVKIEGGQDVLPLVKRLVDIGIPVIGHVGLTPQRQAALSGFRVQGKTAESALRITKDALDLQQAGAFMLIVEAVPALLGKHITDALRIPTIGIGASSHCSGQVLVQNDMLGVFDRIPKFAKRYMETSELATSAIRQYHDEVKARTFPDESKNTYEMPSDEWRRFLEMSEELKRQ